jgi:uncharacterized protein YndB with AHSA1/START domain
MDFSISVDIEAPPDLVWRVLSDGERWPEWTPTVTSVQVLDRRPLAVGTRARIRQPRLPPALWTVTELEDGRSFTWVTRSPGVAVFARHWVEPRGAASRATLSLRFTGLLGPLVGRLTRGLNERYLGLEAASLKKRSEETLRR